MNPPPTPSTTAVSFEVGVSPEAVREGLNTYRGVRRRFEYILDTDEIVFIDDYAHHPTEVRATLEAARATFPERRIVVLFQPHLYSRTRDFAGEFGAALALGADVVALTEIYKARELPIDGVTSDLIAGAAARSGHAPDWLGSRAQATQALLSLVRTGDVVLTMGAGDVTQVGPELLTALQARVS